MVDSTSQAIRETFGTDLLIGSELDLQGMRDALVAALPVERDDVFLEDDVAAAPEMTDRFFEALGQRNLVRLHVLPGPANLTFKADLEFIEPIPIVGMQALADAASCVVALSRQTAFPSEIGTPVGEGYVIFRPGLPPRTGAIDESGPEDDPRWDWVLTDDPLPPLSS